MKTLIITEKPSVARAISQALDGRSWKEDGFISSGDYIITWAVGHLVSLAPPESYRPEWKSWSLRHLPMIPEEMKLVINKRTSKQFKIVNDLLHRKEIHKVIFATDAGAEGELIGRWIYQKSMVNKPVERLWISSLTRESIITGLANLKPASEFDSLFKSAAARARADWIIGLNATRVVSYAMRSRNPAATTYSVGRVQTPTLNKIVQREKEIAGFVPEEYFELVGIFQTESGIQYEGKWFGQEGTKINSEKEAKKIIQETQNSEVNDIIILEEEKIIDPPLFLSLPMLEQQASRKYMLTVAEVDEIAQNLYEKGMITYPRTADHLVTKDIAASFPFILEKLTTAGYACPDVVPDLTTNIRYVGEVSDHHAIIPTGNISKTNEIEKKVYDHIVKVFLAAHYPPGIDRRREIVSVVKKHRFKTTDNVVIESGWRKLWGKTEDTRVIEAVSLPARINQVNMMKKQTLPPTRYTEAALIKEMEKSGLGTPATRSSVLERLKAQSYISLEDSLLVALNKGFELIDFLGDTLLTSEKLTAEWENKFRQIQQDRYSVKKFNSEIDTMAKNIVKTYAPVIESKKNIVVADCPSCKIGKVVQKIKGDTHFYGCSRYHDGCKFFIGGHICGQTLNSKDIRDLIRTKKTKYKVFTFKTGKKVAALQLERDGSTSFIFSRSLIARAYHYLFN